MSKYMCVMCLFFCLFRPTLYKPGRLMGYGLSSYAGVAKFIKDI